MKTMKAIVLTIILSLALTSLLFIGCEPVDENTTGDPRDPYVGEWHFIESFKSTESQSYIVTITKDPDNSSQVIIGNLGNPGSQDITVKGIATSSQVVVSRQNMSNGWVIEGSGSMTNVAKTSMTWDYSLLISADWEPHSATATLQ